MSRVLSLFAILLVASTAVHAQDQGEEWYVGKPITDFSFTGLVTVKAEDLRPLVKPYIGKIFTIDLFWEVQGKLFALDSFENIEGQAKAADDARSAVIVEFTLRERPSASAIEVTGNRDLRSGEILDKIVLKKGDLVSQGKLRADEGAIRALYLDKGYSDVAVSGRFETDAKDNTAVVTFEVSEGAQTTIKEVRFVGNSFASDSTLRNLMKSKPPFLFDTGVFQESKLEEDKKAVVEYYTDRGFVDTRVDRVDRDLESDQGKNHLILTVRLTEGTQWNFGGISFQGNEIFPTDRLAALVYQKPGRVLSLQKLLADYQRVIDLYSENGYIFNSFDRQETRDEGARTISYVMKITERDKAHVESIIFKGNKKTLEHVLRRELPFEEGDIFNRSKVIEGWRNLVNLQFFSSVQPDFPMGSAEGLMNIVFNVEEGSTADINFGLQFSGIDTGFPISGTIKWNERNFMGRGQTLGIDLEASPSRQLASLSFTEPWLLGVRWSAGASLSFEHDALSNILQDILGPVFTDDQSAIAAPDPYTTLEEYKYAVTHGLSVPSQYLMKYDSWNISGALSSGYRYQVPVGWLGVRGGVSSTFRYITYDSEIYRPYELSVRNNLNTWNIINKISATAYLDGRDYFLNPTTGFQVSQGFTYAGGFLFGSRHFIRSDSTLEGFLTLLNLPVTESWSLMFILAAHSGLSLLLPQFAYVDPTGGVNPSWNWSTVTDSTDKLYIDGMTTGRGWTQMYGTYGLGMWDNKVELRMPISKDVLWAVGFFDAVALYSTPGDMIPLSLDPFYFSFGFGIRFSIPQFPIRLYFSKGFQFKSGVFAWNPNETLSLGSGANPFTFSFVLSLGGDVF
jgi:outer membrane protein insertion porin family